MAFSKSLRISRSGLKLFLECPRCFWLTNHHNIKRPPSFPYTLSSAVDFLVKQEFDKYRKEGTLPPVFKSENLDAKLFDGPQLPEWRENFKGVSYIDEDLDATLYGAVDDLLEFSDGSISVIDYKSTGSREINIYNDYRQQMDIYSYLISRNGLEANPNAYFVYYKVNKEGGGFDNVLPFTEELRKVDVEYSWVPEVFERAVLMARQPKSPNPAPDCKHCDYVARVCGQPFSEPTTRKATDKSSDEPEYIPIVD